MRFPLYALSCEITALYRPICANTGYQVSGVPGIACIMGDT
jgi:hypothetical protein